MRLRLCISTPTSSLCIFFLIEKPTLVHLMPSTSLLLRRKATQEKRRSERSKSDPHGEQASVHHTILHATLLSSAPLFLKSQPLPRPLRASSSSSHHRATTGPLHSYIYPYPHASLPATIHHHHNHHQELQFSNHPLLDHRNTIPCCMSRA
jgi:hypothetical protein